MGEKQGENTDAPSQLYEMARNKKWDKLWWGVYMKKHQKDGSGLRTGGQDSGLKRRGELAWIQTHPSYIDMQIFS